MDKIKIRTLLKHYWKKITVQVQRPENMRGENELQNQSRSGRPVTLNSAMLRKSVESNPSTSTRRLSAELGVAQRTVVRHLKAIGKVNKRCREVPHDLTKN